MRSRLRALLLAVLRLVNATIPEGAAKNTVRARLLRHRNALPRELLIRRGDTVLQVGMWRKENLTRLARCVGSAGRVVLVEADAGIAAELEDFAARAGLDQVAIVPKGAFNRKGRQTLKVGDSPTHNRIDGTAVKMLDETFEAEIEIDVDTVDSILAERNIEGIDYAEITVNGVELQVLEGMTGILPRTRRLFLAGYALDARNGEPINRRARDFLAERGFATTISKRKPPARLKSVDLPTDFGQGLLQGHLFAWRSSRRR